MTASGSSAGPADRPEDGKLLMKMAGKGNSYLHEDMSLMGYLEA